LPYLMVPVKDPGVSRCRINYAYREDVHSQNSRGIVGKGWDGGNVTERYWHYPVFALRVKG
jgi:hypothetical protein